MGATEGAELDPLARARIEFAFASALRSSDDVRARALATSARNVAANNPRGTALATRIDRWFSGK